MSVIAVPGSGAGSLAAKNSATTIPIAFGSAGDPAKEGLVASLNRIQLLRKVAPSASRIALLVNPTDLEAYQSTLHEVRAAATGQQILTFDVATSHDIDSAFDSMEHENVDVICFPGLILQRQACPACDIGSASCSSGYLLRPRLS